MDLYEIFAIYLGAISVITLFTYMIDKIKAKAGLWRIPEKVLLGLSLLGGAFGGLIAMYVFRHKTKHWYFVVLNVFGIILHTAVFITIYTLL